MVFASGATGNVAPIATIMDTVAGTNTGLSQPVALALDGAGHIYVANSANNSITAYPVGSMGNASPTVTIGTTTDDAPVRISSLTHDARKSAG